jgi:hypothetical protein
MKQGTNLIISFFFLFAALVILLATPRAIRAQGQLQAGDILVAEENASQWVVGSGWRIA